MKGKIVPIPIHLWGRVHHQPGEPPWLKQPFATDAATDARKPVMQRVLQTRAKRTVRRRLARRREPALGITAWVAGVEAKVPRLMGRVGRVGLPSTRNAIDRFFRAFERFYNTRHGLHAVLSAKRALLLFLIV
jgi:hypothetical protein